MNLRDLLADLSRTGVRLKADGGKLDITAPRGVLTPELRAVLSARKVELLEFLASGEETEIFEALVPSMAERYEPFPLTDTEQAYWVGRAGMTGAGVAMHAYLEVDCRDFDASRFEEAWNRLVERHDMLRAVALPAGKRRILPFVERYAIPVEDMRDKDAASRSAELRERLSHQVISLEQWPLFEVRILQLETQLHRLFLSVDCTFIDAWSFQTLIRELVHLYKTPQIPLTPERLDLSFRDYVLAAERLKETDSYRRSLAYWRSRIATLPPAPELPRARTASLLDQLRFRRWQGTIDKEAYASLRSRAAANGLTLPGLQLACYAEVLAQWSAQPRFTLNVPLFNRAPLHPQVNDTLGTFSSFILVETEQRAGETFAERALRIQEQLWRDLENRHAGGVQIIRELFRQQGSIDGAMMPVVFTSFPSAGGRGSQWVEFVEKELGEVRHIVTQTPQVWIDHQAVYQEDSLYFSWDAAADLFPAGMVDAMFTAYDRLLHRVAEDSAVWKESSPVTLPPEQQQERDQANATVAPLSERLLHSRFFENALRCPDHPAVISDRLTLTYGELRARTLLVAQRLRALGATPNEPVAVVMEKGWEQVVAVLGTLASGAPFLPIDAAVPAERLKYQLENTAAKFVLTQSWLHDAIDWPEGVTAISVDEMEFTGEPPAMPEPAQKPEDLAVVIYTSGSTGLPNAAMIEHKGLVNCIEETIRHFGVKPEDRALALTALHHDMSSFDIFGMLSAGGSLVMPEPQGRRDPSHWAGLMRRNQVTIWNSVPAMMSMLLEYAGNRTEMIPESLRLVFLGGDWIPLTLPERLRNLVPVVRIVSVGGPTETTLWNIWYEVGEVDAEWKSIPYGRPIANTKYHILDDNLRDRPVWATGEMYVSGVGVSRGYWGNPQRTAERFLTHPVSGERMYRTGDLGRYIPGGLIEIMGRKDFQISLRGHRIESAEIETALRQHPLVREAAVIVLGEGLDKRLVAYVVPRQGSPESGELQGFLGGKLPPHMIPSSYMFLEQLPLTANGKLDRKALPQPGSESIGAEEETTPVDAISEQRLAAVVREVLGVERVNTRDNFFELGANSIHLVRIHVRLKEQWNLAIPITDLFQYPSIAALARHLGHAEARPEALARASSSSPTLPLRSEHPEDDIAIIGMSGRFPGARNVDEFWSNLVAGKESIAFFNEEELRQAGVPASALRNPNYVKAGAPLEEIDMFDAAFFGMMPREAENADPQQRLFLECAWEALENAGYSPSSCPSIGVYAGKTMSNYLYPNLGDLTRPVHFFQSLIGNDKDFLATQISYKLNLKGPSVTVQTACSTSLVAVAMACQGLRSGDCAMALAGGVSLKIPHRLGYLYEEGSVFSIDGHCRVFDADALGTVPGSGAGLVVLKRLSDALADGDRIDAVIKGWALNNDGAHKVGFTAPSLEGQAAVIAAAQRRAGVDAGSITYVETHGTGTPIGDPIEVAALTRAFRESTDAQKFCALGSVKSNVGHLDCAAGVAALIKTALSLKHKTLPPSLHYREPNPRIDFENSPFYVNAALAPWEAGDTPRRAGVSSFGIGGTNAHLVLEEAPRRLEEAPEPERPWQTLTLSAKTSAALIEQARRYTEFLSEMGTQPESEAAHAFADACHLANTGRTHFDHRLAVVAESPQDAARKLESFVNGAPEEGIVLPAAALPDKPKIAFLFTGQGSQYVEMGRQLFETEPVFRQAIEECDAILKPHLASGLLQVLYPPPGVESPIHEMTYAQPVLFAVEYALTKLWHSWGVTPDAVMGHSTGEYAAACVAGVFSLHDALRLVAARGRLMEAHALKGETLAIFASESTVTEALLPIAAEIAIAAINGPENVVVSGTPQAIASVAEAMLERGIETRKLNIPRAAHSPLMEPMLAPFAEEAARVSYSAPKIPLASNVTGRLATEDMASAEYWCRQVRRTVQFAAGMETLQELGCTVFLEIGPKPTLIGMAQQSSIGEALWLPSLRFGVPDGRQMLESLAALHVSGAVVDWARLQPVPRRKLALPTYPFERQRYWAQGAGLLPSSSSAARTGNTAETMHPLLGQRLRLALADGERLYEARIGQEDPEYLQSHRIFDTPILPAAAYLEIALAAAAQACGYAATTLEDVLLPRTLVLLEEESATVQCHLTPEADGAFRFRISSVAPPASGSGEEWILHAQGNCFPAQDSSAPPPVDLERLRADFTEEIPVREYYKRALEAGVNFGPPFQGITRLWSREGESLGLVELPAALRPEAAEYTLHPAFLDACLQVIGTAFPPLGAEETFLPVGVERLTVYGAVPESLWSHAVVRSGNGASQHTVKADLRLIGLDGQVVAVLEGLLLQRSNPATLSRNKQELLQHWLYEVVWRKEPSRAAPDTSAERAWLILADRCGVGEKLASLLKAREQQCIVVRRGDAFSDDAPGEFTIDANQPGDYARVLAHCEQALPEQRNVAHLWSLDATGLDAAEIGCSSVLELVRGLAQWKTAPALSLITADAQPAGESASLSNIGQAPLWGLGKVIALEHPELRCRRIDIDNRIPAQAAAELFDELCLEPAGEDQVALHNNSRYVARLVRSQSPPSSAAVSLRQDATYLITGGLGRLGLVVAEWMVASGARNLVLAGRREAVGKVTSQIESLRSTGAKIAVLRADVSNRSEVASLLDEIAANMPPLRGIVHAAGVIDDGLVEKQTWERFANVLAPKAQGAWNLHELTQNLPLDFFVLFSSAASLLGTPGQASHAAANAFLDALAFHRRARGLPALSINWGPWAGFGPEMRGAVSVLDGMSSLTANQGLAILDALLSRPLAQVGVVPIDWMRFLRHSVVPPFFSELAQAPMQSSGTGVGILQQLERAAEQDRMPLLSSHIQSQVARILGLAPSEPVETGKGLFTMGLDSLASLVLRNRLQSSMQCTLPSTLVFNYPTIEALTRFLAQGKLSALFATESAPASDPAAPNSAAAELDQLSQEELASLLAKRITATVG